RVLGLLGQADEQTHGLLTIDDGAQLREDLLRLVLRDGARELIPQDVVVVRLQLLIHGSPPLIRALPVSARSLGKLAPRGGRATTLHRRDGGLVGGGVVVPPHRRRSAAPSSFRRRSEPTTEWAESGDGDGAAPSP